MTTLKLILRDLPFPINQITSLAGGRINYIYKFTVRGNKIPLVLRVARHSDIQSLQYEIRFHNELQRQGLDCPSVIPFPNGELIHFIRDAVTGKRFPCILLQFIDGNYPQKEEHMEVVGKSIALLHKVNVPDFARQRSGFNVDVLKQRDIPSDIANVLAKDMKFYWEKIEEERKGLDIGLCHGDLFPQNTLIKGERLYFLDFENMGRDFVLLDLGMALFGMATQFSAEIDERKAYRLLEAYLQVNPLTDGHIRLLPVLVGLAGIKISLWRHQFWPEAWERSLIAANKWFSYQF
ncbi:phosphotransferase enzyme family protein [Brevibacillus centrosporus]|uniref:Ser/Thr protein kinase RdoA involved in Cpx stress response, MazF antagonist n=1 Tax=Brevibacillus centrosporus TaxID=54910 RepID=A0A1I4E2H1_9BACL|nr:phosphotransferase [Brevibacillus centrosporus]SFL00058.1 Ser/Thr protein kinase RdoA involved in Cpx stress response, MazF antagonist [Brevibacillus centrosporus]